MVMGGAIDSVKNYTIVSLNEVTSVGVRMFKYFATERKNLVYQRYCVLRTLLLSINGKI